MPTLVARAPMRVVVVRSQPVVLSYHCHCAPFAPPIRIFSKTPFCRSLFMCSSPYPRRLAHFSRSKLEAINCLPVPNRVPSECLLSRLFDARVGIRSRMDLMRPPERPIGTDMARRTEQRLSNGGLDFAQNRGLVAGGLKSLLECNCTVEYFGRQIERIVDSLRQKTPAVLGKDLAT